MSEPGLAGCPVGRAERGLGGGLTLDAWQRLGLALGMPLVVSLQRDVHAGPADAGHLAIQELVLRTARAAGHAGLVELSTRPSEPWRSIDVALVDDRKRRIIVVECWNTIGDLGAAIRSSSRKPSEADALASARWGAVPVHCGLVWVVRATAAKRSLVRRYPELFAARFPGSSVRWARALTAGGSPPDWPGLLWASVDGRRIYARRR